MGKNYMARVLLTLFMGWLAGLQAIANHTMKVEASNEVSTLAVLANARPYGMESAASVPMDTVKTFDEMARELMEEEAQGRGADRFSLGSADSEGTTAGAKGVCAQTDEGLVALVGVAGCWSDLQPQVLEVAHYLWWLFGLRLRIDVEPNDVSRLFASLPRHYGRRPKHEVIP